MNAPEPPPDEDGHPGHSLEALDVAARLNQEYISWDQLRTRRNLGYPAEEIWKYMSTFRRSSRRTCRIGSLRFSWNITPRMINSLHTLDMNHTAGSLLGHRLNRHSRHIYAVDSSMNETISSAVLSGAMIQTAAAKKLLRERRAPKNPAETIVCNAYASLEMSREYKDREMSQEMLFDLNRTASGGESVLRNTDSPIPEEYSRDPSVEPMPFREIGKALADLGEFVADDSVHPLIRAFAAEYILFRIRPFESWNGITARSVASWLMSRSGYDVSTYLAISSILRARSAQYRLAFETSAAEGDDMTYAVGFCLSSMCEAMDSFLEDAERRAQENNEMLEGLSVNDLNPRQRTILADLARNPTGSTISEVAAKHQVSYQTARADLILLSQRRLVRKGSRDGHRDTYVYSAKTL